jgi:hypothetical protein
LQHCGIWNQTFPLYTHKYHRRGSFGVELAEALKFEQAIKERSATPELVERLARTLVRGLVPELPEYAPTGSDTRTHAVITKRLLEEGRAAIIATNPPLATGFLADRVLLYLLARWGRKLLVEETPEMPGYLYFDAARMQAKVVREKWW